MSTHVAFVGALFVVWGALTTVVGVSTLALGIGAAALIASGGAGDGQFAAGLTAAAFTTLAFIAILWGVAHILVGIPLRRRRQWSRLAALSLGSIDLVLLPYGTALGCYTLWTLLSEDGREIFRTSETGGEFAHTGYEEPAAIHALDNGDDMNGQNGHPAEYHEQREQEPKAKRGETDQADDQ